MLSLPKVGDFDTSVPPATQQLILKIKDAIADLTDAYMNCQPPDRDPKRIQEALTALIPATDAKGSQYGSPLTFEVAATPDPRHLVSITATLGIMCGSDSMLLIYAPHENSWMQVLRWQAPPYEKVGGGFWIFQYRISPPDTKGAWFVLTSRVGAWCNSLWSGIEYAILRPGRPPKVLLSGSDSMWWGGQDFGALAVTQNTVDIRYHSNSLDGGVHNRLFIRRYQIAGDSVKRIQPVAISPRDFVDEWIVSPWTESQHWSAPGLESFHALAQKGGFEFDSAKRCVDQPDTIQVAVADTKTNAAALYFRVAGKTTFTMINIRTTPDPLCSGPNILDTMSTK